MSAAPIRLKVAYRTAGALLGEFTKTAARGTVELKSKKAVPVGTQFVFELRAQEVQKSVEVKGEVIQVTQADPGNFVLHIKYDPSEDRSAIDAMLERIFDEHKYEKLRKHPRIPIWLRTNETDAKGPTFIVHDISRGGVGVEVEAPALPPAVKPGTPFFCEINLSFGVMQLHGEVAWAYAATGGKVMPRFGVLFGKLRRDTSVALDKLLHLHALPPPPWRAHITFGMDAVTRMPSSD